MESNYTLAKIGLLIKEGKIRKTHDMIVYLFQLWLERKGISKENLIVLEEYKGLTPDIIVHINNNVLSVWEIIEPDPTWSLSDQTVRKKVETMLIKAYAFVYHPKAIILSDGMRMYIYDGNGKLISEINDISEINVKKEKEIEQIVKGKLT